MPSNPKTGSIIAQRKTYIEEMKDRIKISLQEEDFQNIIEGYGAGFDDAMRKLLREVYQMYFFTHLGSESRRVTSSTSSTGSMRNASTTRDSSGEISMRRNDWNFHLNTN